MGKNQFNSTFPTALACYMRDQRIDAVYVKVTENLKTRCATISIDELFNTGTCNENLYSEKTSSGASFWMAGKNTFHPNAGWIKQFTLPAKPKNKLYFQKCGISSCCFFRNGA